jgi:hypothetical protein
LTRQNKITASIIVLGIWGLLAANGVKDFYFEMRLKSHGELISYSSLSEFCGWTGDRKPGESEWQYRWRSARNMFYAVITMSFLSVLFFGSVLGSIIGAFYLGGAFRDEA